MASKTNNKMSANLNKMLLSKGFNPDDEDVGVVVVFENKNYIVRMQKNKKVFEEFSEDLKTEEYEEVKEETTTTDEVKEEVKEDVKEEVKKPSNKKSKKVAEKKAKSNEDETTDKESDIKDTEKKTKKTKKTKVVDVVEGDVAEKKKKKRDPSKPKRIREKTCHNMYVSEKMFELAKTMPDMKGRDRFKEVNRMWKEMPQEEKDLRVQQFKEAKLAKTEEVVV